jgi:hypothetical protein
MRRFFRSRKEVFFSEEKNQKTFLVLSRFYLARVVAIFTILTWSTAWTCQHLDGRLVRAARAFVGNDGKNHDRPRGRDIVDEPVAAPKLGRGLIVLEDVDCNPHWDYNPWNQGPNTGWQNIPIGSLPVLK